MFAFKHDSHQETCPALVGFCLAAIAFLCCESAPAQELFREPKIPASEKIEPGQNEVVAQNPFRTSAAGSQVSFKLASSGSSLHVGNPQEVDLGVQQYGSTTPDFVLPNQDPISPQFPDLTEPGMRVAGTVQQ